MELQVKKTPRPRIRMPRFHTMRTDWLARAALLPGRSLHYAVAIHRCACIRNSPTVTMDGDALERFGITRDAAGDALTRLIAAGLVMAERGRGKAPEVTMLDRDGRALAMREGSRQ